MIVLAGSHGIFHGIFQTCLMTPEAVTPWVARLRWRFTEVIWGLEEAALPAKTAWTMWTSGRDPGGTGKP